MGVSVLEGGVYAQCQVAQDLSGERCQHECCYAKQCAMQHTCVAMPSRAGHCRVLFMPSTRVLLHQPDTAYPFLPSLGWPCFHQGSKSMRWAAFDTCAAAIPLPANLPAGQGAGEGAGLPSYVLANPGRYGYYRVGGGWRAMAGAEGSATVVGL